MNQPLGVTPKHIWTAAIYTERFNDLVNAIRRYHEAGEIIPHEWILESIQVMNRLHDHKYVTNKQLFENNRFFLVYNVFKTSVDPKFSARKLFKKR